MWLSCRYVIKEDRILPWDPAAVDSVKEKGLGIISIYPLWPGGVIDSQTSVNLCLGIFVPSTSIMCHVRGILPKIKIIICKDDRSFFAAKIQIPILHITWILFTYIIYKTDWTRTLNVPQAGSNSLLKWWRNFYFERIMQKMIFMLSKPEKSLRMDSANDRCCIPRMISDQCCSGNEKS